MANLIVTVIAIALVAVASLMGAYYGGQAFLQGTAKANASTMINQGSQIGAGWILFTNDETGTSPSGVGVLVPKYITENPTPPAGVVTGEEYFAFRTSTSAIDHYAGLDLGDTEGANEVCTKIDINGGNIGTDETTSRVEATTAAGIAGRFGCFQSTAAGDLKAVPGKDALGADLADPTGKPAAGNYFFYYKVK